MFRGGGGLDRRPGGTTQAWLNTLWSRMVDWSYNRQSWDAAVNRHALVKNDTAAAIASGKCDLPPEVLAELSRARMARILQPMCNDGRELLSLVRGGSYGVGVDFSTAAIERAEATQATLGYRCDFVCADICDWLHRPIAESFDTVFTSLGTLWWLRDLRDFLVRLAAVTADGARMVIWEFHPLVHMLDDELQLAHDYPFCPTERHHPGGVQDYVGDPDAYAMPDRSPRDHDHAPFVNPHPVSDCLWSLSAIVEAITDSPWQIRRLREFDHIWRERYLGGLVRGADVRFKTRVGTPRLPLTLLLSLQRMSAP